MKNMVQSCDMKAGFYKYYQASHIAMVLFKLTLHNTLVTSNSHHIDQHTIFLSGLYFDRKKEGDFC